VSRCLACGPQTPAIRAMIERASQLTPSELTALADAWDTWDAAGTASGDVSWAAARTAAWAAGDASWAAWAAAGGASWAAVGDASWTAAWTAAWAAGCAVGGASGSATMAARAAALATALQDQLTQEHYRALLGPWDEAVGTPRPADPDRATRPRGQGMRHDR
jgi:hypothetical protein